MKYWLKILKNYIYHICRIEEWDDAKKVGRYYGSSQDVIDGFMHFSTREQVVGSAKKHRNGQKGLALLTVDPKTLGDQLKWEKSEKGDIFPHLYGPLITETIVKRDLLPLGDDQLHIFPKYLKL